MSGRELPAGWTLATLAELGELARGKSKHRPRNDLKLFGDKYPFIQTGDVSNAQGEITSAKAFYSDFGLNQSRLWPKGTLCITIAANIAETAILGFDACFPDSVVGFCGDLACDTKYISYYFPTVKGDLQKFAPATAQKNINLETLSNVVVPLPPLPEQRRIVEKIEALGTRSRRAREALDTLPALIDRYRQSILAAAFRGDLTADWRARSAYTPIAKTLAAVAPPSQSRGGREATDAIIPGVGGIAVNDPGTPLPDGWAWVALRRVARQETGHTPSRSVAEYWDGNIAWLGIKDANIHHGKVISDTVQHITEEGLDNSSARLLPSGTVCLSRTASVGYVTIMGKDMATSQDFATWTCGDALDPHYLMYALMSEGDNIRRFGEGSTHTTIYFPEIRAFHIAMAPVEEQREIVRRIKAAMATVDVLERQLRAATSRLASLDQSILAKAFRGELAPQDPNDEPASVLLERIRAERAAAGPAPRRGRRPKAAGGD